MKNVTVWSRLELTLLPGAGADPIWSEPESAPGPQTSRARAAHKSGGSATLVSILQCSRFNREFQPVKPAE